MSDGLTHSLLVEHARLWLAKRCAVVITEMGSSAGETPDAIGWSGSHSTLVECKASRSDFLADAAKPHRRDAARGMGLARYFLVPFGMVLAQELPPKWGLIYLGAGKTKVVLKSGLFSSARNAEVQLLLSSIRRIGHTAPKGVSVRCYTMQSKNTASITTADDPSANVPHGTEYEI